MEPKFSRNMEHETGNAERLALLKYFAGLAPKTELRFKEIMAANGITGTNNRSRDYMNMRACLKSLVSNGYVNTFKDKQNSGDFLYRLRQKGEPIHHHRARRFHGRVSKVDKPVDKPASYKPATFMVIAPSPMMLTVIQTLLKAEPKGDLDKIAAAIEIEVNGQTLFMGYGNAKLVAKVV